MAAFATAFLLVWGNIAVGFAGSEDNRINIIFFAVPLVVIGSVIARFRSASVAFALIVRGSYADRPGVVALVDGHFHYTPNRVLHRLMDRVRLYCSVAPHARLVMSQSQ